MTTAALSLCLFASSAAIQPKARSGSDLGADGTEAAELTGWLSERVLDPAITSVSNYRNSLTKYVTQHVDLDHGVLRVHWQRAVASGVAENGGVIEKAPKGKSKRSVTLGKAGFPSCATIR